MAEVGKKPDPGPKPRLSVQIEPWLEKALMHVADRKGWKLSRLVRALLISGVKRMLKNESKAQAGASDE